MTPQRAPTVSPRALALLFASWLPRARWGQA